MGNPLPFLKKQQKVAGVAAPAVEHRAPDEPEKAADPGMEAAAQDLIDAVHARDVKGVAAALKAAFTLADNDDFEGEAP